MAVAAVVGAVLAAAGTLLTWFTITVGGISAPESTITGLEGRDGRTVLGAAAVGLVAAVLVALGRRLPAARVALVAAGAVTLIVGIAGVIDALSKDEEVEDEFGIAADRVAVELGPGLWMVNAGGVALLGAGILVAGEVLAGVPARPARALAGRLGAARRGQPGSGRARRTSGSTR